jgi:hypothetical protein
MHFISERVREWCFSFFVDLLSCGFSLLTCFASKCRPIVDKVNALDGTASDHSLDSFWCDVGQASVQRCKINTLLRGCRCKHPFNLVEPIMAGGNRPNDLVRCVLNVTSIILEGDGVASLCDVID